MADLIRVDWFRILADLSKAGVSVQELSRRTRIPASTLHDLKQDKEPRYCDGEAIIMVWREVMTPAMPRTIETKRSRLQ